jgi:hypothetical protein
MIKSLTILRSENTQEKEILLSEKTSTISLLSLLVSHREKMSVLSRMEKYSFLKRSTIVHNAQNEEDSSVSRFLVHEKTTNVHVENTNESDIRELSVNDVV